MRIRLIDFVNAIALILLTSGTLVASDLAADSTWPQWRGPQRDGQVHGAEWPDQLVEDHLQSIWQVELGPSYSGPIVAEDRIFVTETKDRKLEVVRALDRTTGKQLWEASWDGSLSVPFFAKSNGDWIRATPAYDGERLYVAGMRDVLVCLNASNGKEIWRVDFVKLFESPVPAFGFVSSPLVIGDYVYVQAGAGLVKLNKLTGEVLWRTLKDDGGMFGSAFSSPVLATIAGTPQLLVQTRNLLAGVDPENGRVYWEQEITAFRGMNILTPTAFGDRVFTSSYGGRSFCFNVTRNGEEWKISETWTNKAQGYMSSPILIDEHIFMHLRNQRLTCLNAETGEERWTTTPFGKYWSMVTNGKKILALDERGELLLIRAAPDAFDLLDRRQIGEDSWAHLAVCGDLIFVRELDAVTAYRWK